MRVNSKETITYSSTDLVYIPIVLLIKWVTLGKILNYLNLSHIHNLKTTLHGFFPFKLNETLVPEPQY